MKNFSRKNHLTIDKLPLIGMTKSVLSLWLCGSVVNRISVQRRSKMTKCEVVKMRIMGIMRRMGRMRWKTKLENSPAQRDSKFSKWRRRPLSPSCLFSPLAFKNAPVEEGSKIYKSGMGHMGLMRPIGLMENENSSVEDGSKIYKSISSIASISSI